MYYIDENEGRVTLFLLYKGLTGVNSRHRWIAAAAAASLVAACLGALRVRHAHTVMSLRYALHEYFN